jgi:ATP/maltotriose-dependent transcriptional regulator MalT
MALLHHALQVALENDLPAPAARAYINLSHTTHELTRLDEALAIQTDALAHARRVGIRWAEWWMLGHLTHTYVELGDWDAVERMAAEIPNPEEFPDAQITAADAGRSLIDIHLARGEVAEAERTAERYWRSRDDSDVQWQTFWAATWSRVDLGAGRVAEALQRALDGLESRDRVGLNHTALRGCWIVAMEATVAQGDLDAADRVFDMLASRPAGHVYPYLRANMRRFRAAIAAARGDHATADTEFRAAAAAFGDIKCVFDRAVAQTEHFEWLVGQGRSDEEATRALEADARAEFERLRATAWLDRLARSGADAVPSTAG